MSRHLDDDVLLDLVLNLLPREREEEILEHVTHCRSCEERMRHQGAEMERLAPGPGAGVLHQSGLTARTRPTTEPSPARQRDPAGGRIRRWFGGPWPTRRLLPVGGLVAGLALLLILVIPGPQRHGLQIEANWLPEAPVLIQRGGISGNAMSGKLADGLAAYNGHDLPNAIRNLETAPVSRQLEPFRCLYLANALALSGDYARAVEVLRPIGTNLLPEPWTTEAHWTLLVAFEGAGMRASADSLRHVLSTHPGEIGERVRRLR